MSTEMKNGVEACSNCGCLLCIQKRGVNGDTRRRKTEQIEIALNPEPALDVNEVLCAGCGEVLWNADQ
jgi:hypothetical protein